MGQASARTILQRLDESGRSRTAPRERVIAAALRRSQPFTALELVAELRRQRVGRATVFRTLDLLVSIGALSRIHAIEAGQRCVRYTPCAPSHHHHLVCQACGRVDEIAADVLDGRIAAVASARGFRTLGHTVEIVGLCPGCQR
ncbi:MAG TPA: Fur family transcriptional regulator [Candidatus Limnocylindria bacterium]|nr:Fur family transcriptional regulator [Candidatus Limnocylindria bacterium]